MPSLSRRDFLIVGGAAGAVVMVARFGLGRLLNRRQLSSNLPTETLMPASKSSLVFASGYAAVDQAGIHAFMLSEPDGKLTPHGSFAGILNPSFCIIHPNGRWMYAVSETSQANDNLPGGVCALSFERDPFAMRLLNQRPSGGDWPCHLQLDRTGQWLFVANYGTGSASVFPIHEDGSLGEMSDHVQHTGSGPNKERQEGPHAHSVTLTPDNQFALIADLGLDQIVIYRFDSQTGKLIPHGITHTQPGAGPRHLAFHPNGQWVYIANELDNTVTVFDYDKTQGALTEKQGLSSLPSGAGENTLADIHLSASGQRVYASNRGDNSVAVYDVGEDGLLSLVSIPKCGGDCPRNFALSPGEQVMVVANQFSNEICILPVLAGEQALGAVVRRKVVPGASCVQFA
jgi:6-phosphogluconolactonase